MASLLDAIFSMVIGGIILISVQHLNTNINATAASKMTTTIAQQNMTVFTDVLETDLRKAGYNAFVPNLVSVAESSKIRFKGDFDNDNTVDSVTYSIGTTPDAGALNANARVITRQLNAGEVQPIRIGATRLRFWYFDAAGNPLAANPAVANPSLIRTIKAGVSIELAVQIDTYRKPNGTIVYDTTLSKSSWERVIKPVNLR
jgi:hypothetical protein